MDVPTNQHIVQAYCTACSPQEPQSDQTLQEVLAKEQEQREREERGGSGWTRTIGKAAVLSQSTSGGSN